MNVAMFGGSFNPVHNAHVNFAKKVIEAVNLQKLYIMPTYSSPHKTGEGMALPEDRFNMCNIAFKEIKNAYVSDIEILRQGQSYTCDTLKQLKELHPEDNLFLVVGADMYMTLLKWKNPIEIFKLANIITFPRNNDDYNDLKEYSITLKEYGADTVILNEPLIKLSSTDIRQNINNKDFIKEHLNSDVYSYIVNNNLYGM